MAPDALAQPGADGLEVTARDDALEVHAAGAHGVEQLGAVGSAEGVGREVAEVAARPVHVLQAAQRVGGHVEAEVALVALVPQAGDVGRAGLAAHEQLLDLVADDDVERVGELVGLGADEARLGAVHGEVELVGAHPIEAAREMLAQRGEQHRREGLAAADVVLEEAALTLVDTARDAAVQHGVVVGRVDVLLVHGVAALVQHRVDVADDVVLVDVRGDVGVAAADGVGEGVLGLGQGERVHVQALDHHELAGERHLGVVVEMPLDAGAARLPALLLHGGHERHHAVLHLREKLVVEGLGGAALVFVEQGLVGVLVGLAQQRHLAAGGHEAVEVGLEGLPVVGVLGAHPRLLGLAGEAREAGRHLGRDVDLVGAVAGQHAHLGRTGRIELARRGGCGEALEQLAGGDAADELVRLLLERGQRLGACGACAGRVAGLAREHDRGRRVAVGKQVRLQLVERNKVFSNGHRGSFSRESTPLV